MTAICAESQGYFCIKLDYLCGQGTDMLCFRRGLRDKTNNESFTLVEANPTLRQNAFLLVEIKESGSEYKKALKNIINSLRVLNSDIRPKRAVVVIKEKIGKYPESINITELTSQIETDYKVKLETIFIDEIENSDLKDIKDLILNFE